MRTLVFATLLASAVAMSADLRFRPILPQPPQVRPPPKSRPRSRPSTTRPRPSRPTSSRVRHQGAQQDAKTSHGQVIFEKPGKMSWTLRPAQRQPRRVRRQELKVYEKENQQMFEQPVDKSQYPAALRS